VSFDSLPEAPHDVGGGPSVLSLRIQRAVDELPERLKRVLMLCELAGMSYGEVAAVTGVKEGTVGSRRNRALALLRERLQPQEVMADADRS
jgi:RNA polymerase sigma-70 factor (ECF subfamily)